MTAKDFSTVLGIEANPSLCEAWLLSGVPHNVIVENLAISDANGYADLRMPIIRESGIVNLGEATIAEANNFKSADYSGFEKIQVRCSTLDKLLADRYSDWNVVAIKIDVEGNEGKVIEGALRTILKNLPILLVEMEHRHGANIEDFFDRVESLGYIAFRVSSSGNNLLPTKANELRELQSHERWQEKKRNLYTIEYVNTIFFIPRQLEPQLSGLVSVVGS
jgi:FkbM family methyltransferase